MPALASITSKTTEELCTCTGVHLYFWFCLQQRVALKQLSPQGLVLMDCKYWTWMLDLIFEKQCGSQWQYFSLAVIGNNVGAALKRAQFPQVSISSRNNLMCNLYDSTSQCCGWWMVEMFLDGRMLLCQFSYNIRAVGWVESLGSFHVAAPNARDPRDQVRPCLHSALQNATFRPSVSGQSYYNSGFMFSD